MNLTDRTPHAPGRYRLRERDPSEVDLAVLHQTGPIFAPDKVRAHFLVMPTNEVLMLHHPLARLRYGSSTWNARCVTIEHAAHYPGRYTAAGVPKWAAWNEKAKPACAPRARLEDFEEQVHASRALLTHLRAELPSLRFVGAHRQVQAGKGGCCGPDLWREVGEWAVRVLGLELVDVAPTGSPLPADWRQAPTIADQFVAPVQRAYDGPLEVRS